MLSRLASGQIHPATQITTSACRVCICACGSLFAPNAAVINQPPKRHASKITRKRSTKRAPSTIKRENAEHRLSRDKDYARTLQQYHETQASGLYHRARDRHLNLGGPEPGRVVDFLNEFNGLCGREGYMRPEEFGPLVRRHGLAVQDCYDASMDLLKKGGIASVSQKVAGRALVFSLSYVGVLDATVQILSQSLLAVERNGKKTNPFRGAQFNAIRGHLRKAVDAGNSRALVLEGKIAVELGDEEYAIECFNRAMEGAVLRSEQMRRDRKAGIGLDEKEEVKDPVQLSAPWYELALLHDARAKRETDREKQLQMWVEWHNAILVGTEQDDPTCFYLFAEHELGFVSPGIYTSKWLHYVTKAAVSGITAAMHDLGVFYAKSRWPYVDDEPPDELKPTPFDRYPVQKTSSFDMVNAIRTFFLGEEEGPYSQEDSIEHIWRRAIWPSTSDQRATLALFWLDLAGEMNHVPSILVAAQLRGGSYLWASSGAPKTAVNLENSRYKFASAEEYAQSPWHERHRVAPDDEGLPYNMIPVPPSKEQVTNPHYDVEKAKEHLRDVVMAGYAVVDRHERSKRLQLDVKRKGIERSLETIESPEARLAKETPPDYKRWFKNPEVCGLWESEAESLYNLAVEVCNEKGWDLYDLDGNLLLQAEGNRK
ncbi:hypothetical protein MBLNU230_g4861t1 [Neophaeotheca triangularis]